MSTEHDPDTDLDDTYYEPHVIRPIDPATDPDTQPPKPPPPPLFEPPERDAS